MPSKDRGNDHDFSDRDAKRNCSIVWAFADTLSFLVLGGVIQALGACAASVLSRAIARDLFDGEALARALALTMIAMEALPLLRAI